MGTNEQTQDKASEGKHKVENRASEAKKTVEEKLAPSQEEADKKKGEKEGEKAATGRRRTREYEEQREGDGERRWSQGARRLGDHQGQGRKRRQGWRLKRHGVFGRPSG